MVRLVINVPDALKDKAASQAVKAGYPSMEAYLQDILRDGVESDSLSAPEQQTIRDGNEFEAMIEKGIASGKPVELTDADWERKRVQLLARHQQRTLR